MLDHHPVQSPQALGTAHMLRIVVLIIGNVEHVFVSLEADLSGLGTSLATNSVAIPVPFLRVLHHCINTHIHTHYPHTFRESLSPGILCATTGDSSGMPMMKLGSLGSIWAKLGVGICSTA